MAFHRVNGEAEEGRDLYQRLVEHVLQDDDTALEGGVYTKRDTAVLTASLRINISKGSGGPSWRLVVAFLAAPFWHTVIAAARL